MNLRSENGDSGFRTIHLLIAGLDSGRCKNHSHVVPSLSPLPSLEELWVFVSSGVSKLMDLGLERNKL